MTSQKYLYTRNQCPASCPQCGNSDISHNDINFPELNTIVLDYVCECGFEWTETYKFVDWKPSEEDLFILTVP